ncbi:hypothetical protein QO010_000921 [Caulobacter ginsengisoli]|uniref:Secreted protein n=1 Tax=Caulobacter ginsengisoli TaxID=400775 RepID=A0ABU0IMD4_9CAUL|nr:hypothetical protein [Caulobacter ginsengisoli]MDQ0463173.1 hypothetical protein [Caulobacter ginsengisoli]
MALTAGTAFAAPAVSEPPKPTPDQPLVCIYRVVGMGLPFYPLTLDVDNTVVARLMPRQYTCFLASAGDHELGQRWPDFVDMNPRQAASTHWEGGQTYYYCFQAGGGAVCGKPGAKVARLVASDKGAAAIQKYKYVPAGGNP